MYLNIVATFFVGTMCVVLGSCDSQSHDLTTPPLFSLRAPQFEPRAAQSAPGFLRTAGALESSPINAPAESASPEFAPPLQALVGETSVPTVIVGSRFELIVDTERDIAQIAARVGESAAVLARENGLSINGRLKQGRMIHVDNRHIVPAQMSEGILINLPQRMLFVFRHGELLHYYPIGPGKPDWATPTGDFKVVEKRRDPIWTVPESIQQEMEDEGRPVLTEVQPGPGNPLAGFWIGLSLAGYGIHGTTAPATIFSFRSHGCIRMNVDDARALFADTYVGQPVKIQYEPVMLTVNSGNGEIFLEVHRDVYDRSGDPNDAVHGLVTSGRASGRLDWDRARDVTRLKEGLPRTVAEATSSTQGAPSLPTL